MPSSKSYELTDDAWYGDQRLRAGTEVLVLDPDPESMYWEYTYQGGHAEEEHQHNFRPVTKRRRAPKPPKPAPLPAEVWVMSFNGSTMAGSFSHVSSDDPFYRTEEECQRAIDEMPSWPGMGVRSRYQPLRLVSSEKTSS